MNLQETSQMQEITTLKRGLNNLRQAMAALIARESASKPLNVDLLERWRERLERWEDRLAELEETA